MNTTRQFSFRDDSTSDSLDVTIPEVIDADYGFYVWPCAPVLAQYVWSNRDKMPGKTTLELGAGTALPSIVAAKCGARAHISDSTSNKQTLENAKKAVAINKLSDVPIHGITWGIFDEHFMTLPEIDIILASDCFYSTKDFEDVIVTFAYLLRRNPHAEIWCTYQDRSATRSIEYYLKKWKLDCTMVDLSSFDADEASIAGSSLPGNHIINMYIFKAKASVDSSAPSTSGSV